MALNRSRRLPPVESYKEAHELSQSPKRKSKDEPQNKKRSVGMDAKSIFVSVILAGLDRVKR